MHRKWEDVKKDGKIVKAAAKCTCEECKCKDCSCEPLDKETAAFVEKFSHRELGVE